MSEFAERERLEKIENALERYLPEKVCTQAELYRAMRYSLLCGGKRIRPVLLLEFCRLCGGNENSALPYACAVEMIHTYSLIHDDLPCMDDDDMRRGRPSNHKQFGEAMALLAGDALLTQAFALMMEDEAVKGVGAERAARAAGILANRAGAPGMVGGQVIDLASEGKKISLEDLEEMDRLKTGNLIIAACTMGCVLGGGGDQEISAASQYAQAVGLAFQVVDDILDVTGDESDLGKKTGSDGIHDKCTYVSLLGLEKAQKKADELTEQALSALDSFPGDTSYLRNLAEILRRRTH